MFYLFHCYIRRASTAVRRIIIKKQKRPGTRPNRSVWQAIYVSKGGTMISFYRAITPPTNIKVVGSVKFKKVPRSDSKEHSTLIKTVPCIRFRTF
jgi:hypothetical protein